MKFWKSFPLLFTMLLAITFLATSCGEDRAIEEETAYVVDVEIISPANNSTMAINENFTVEVDYTRKENTIHNIKVEIVDMAGNQVMNLVERHAHVANEFTFKVDNISISQAGTYTLRAATTDLHIDGDEHGSGDENGHDTDNNLVEHTIIIQ